LRENSQEPFVQSTDLKSLTSFIWSVADLLRGSFKQSEYGQIILPFVVMRRLDCLLEGTKDAVIDAYQSLPDDADEEFNSWRLHKAAKTDVKVYNTSRNTFARLRNQSPKQLHDNLIDYIRHFSPAVSHVFTDNYNLIEILRRLEETETLWPVFDRFCQVDLHPDRVDNLTMGYLFEDLLRRFSEMSNETAGEHFTPRELIRLCMALLMAGDEQAKSGTRVIRSLYDPTCGGGGGLSVGSQALHEINPNLIIQPYGQEMNPASYGICQSDMLIRGEDPENIALGNTLTDDKHEGKKFHFMFANPPYGVDWKRYKAEIEAEHKTLGFDGRFGAGLPRTSDGQLLFVQHMVSKFRDDAQGSRAAIVMNGSPLFTGGAGSGESEIRRWLLENDLIDAIVALPTDLFYNTGIQTYVYLLANRKPDTRKGKVQLIDASGERFWKAMRKSLGSKRREVPASAIEEIAEIYRATPNGDHELAKFSKVFDTIAFGYREIRVERPLRLKFEVTEENIQCLTDQKSIQKLGKEDRDALVSAILTNMKGQVWMDRSSFLKDLDQVLKGLDIKVSAALKKTVVSALGNRDENAEICRDKNGNPEADPTLRDHELVPLKEDWQEYFSREVAPFVSDAWVDTSYKDNKDGEVGRVGYEINFNRFFYQYVPPRLLSKIDVDLKALEAEIANLLKEVIL
jgi:type I restriction enzyme M protein